MRPEGAKETKRPQRAGRIRRGARRLLSLVLSALAGVLAFELYLRASSDHAAMTFLEELYVPDYELSYTLKPNLVGTLRGTAIALNDLGLRHDGPVGPKGDGELRVLAIGDSMTFGLGVDSDGSWPKQLENKLRVDMPQVTVINAGVPSYDTFVELAQLRRIQQRIAPDLVLVGYWNNDTGKSSHMRYRDVPGYGLFKEILYGSRAVSAIRTALAAPSIDPTTANADASTWLSVEEVPGYDTPFSVAHNPEFQRILDAIGGLAAWSKETQIPVLFLHLPSYRHALSSHVSERIYAIIRGHAEAAGLPYVDLRAAYAGHEAEALDLCLLREMNDSHTSARGNALIAESLVLPVEAALKR